MVPPFRICLPLVLAISFSDFRILPITHAFLGTVAIKKSVPVTTRPNPLSARPRNKTKDTSDTNSNSNNSNSKNSATEDNFLLQEFKTHTGEVIDPYRILKVPRTADRLAIKRSYRDLSRRYHPDGVRYKDILPGACNNLADVREHWEKIQLSYEILSEPKRRARYDRHTAIADPAAALQRAAVNAAWNGALGVGKGLLGVGAFAVQQVTTSMANRQKKGQAPPTSKEATSAAATPRAVPETEAN